MEHSGEQREYTVEEVAKHDNYGSAWMILEDNVLDITKFLNEHPGGDEVYSWNWYEISYFSAEGI